MLPTFAAKSWEAVLNLEAMAPGDIHEFCIVNELI